MNPLLIKFIFEHKNNTYEANTQIRKRKNNNINITVGFYGDNFPCIILNYIDSKKIFKIDKIRAQSFGGYSLDDRMLCIRNTKTKEFLPEKGSLDILIMLSLSIFDYFRSNNYIDSSTNVLIKDMAMKDEYPLSWLKYRNIIPNAIPDNIANAIPDNNGYSSLLTYSKYGFQLRGKKYHSLCYEEEYIDSPDLLFSFENYLKDVIPRKLSLNLKNVISKMNNTKRKEFLYQLHELNNILKRKRINTINIENDTTIKNFIFQIFETKRQKEYKQIICLLDEEIQFDIRGYWFLDFKYYNFAKIVDVLEI